MLQHALRTGRAELLSETFVSRIRTEGGRATGVDVIGPDGVERTVAARHVVVAGGAVETPRLLLLSGFEHPLIGRYLMMHFQTINVGIMNERLHAHRGRSVTHLHDDCMIVDEAARLAARAAGLPWLRGGLVEHGGGGHPVMEGMFYPWGPMHKKLMAESPLRDRLWAFIMQGEDLPQATNRVDLDPEVKDVRGFPVARITYQPHRHELAASAHHGPKHIAVLEDMGATWTATTTSPLVAGAGGLTESPFGGGTGGDHFSGPISAIPASRHVMGTTRMGSDPTASVVDAEGRMHDIPNVVIADSSVFVTSAGYGPTLTLVALAARAAGALAGEAGH
ncbi:MAG: GMC oxidoreductase, partial [Acidimicrobiales bacterium]